MVRVVKKSDQFAKTFHQENNNMQDLLVIHDDKQVVFPRPGLVTQDSPTLIGILTLGKNYKKYSNLRIYLVKIKSIFKISKKIICEFFL